MKKIAIIPSKGLGDLMILLNLAHQLKSNYKVTVFHHLLDKLGDIFFGFEKKNRPQEWQPKDFEGFDACVLVFEDSPFFESLYPRLLSFFQDKLTVLNPVVTAKRDYKFCDYFFFNPKISFTQNLALFANQKFGSSILRSSACINLKIEKDPKLVILHTTSSRLTKNWGNRNFKKVKKILEKKGFRVMYATLPHESDALAQGLYSGLLTLNELSLKIAEASLVIANDSGIGHLASSLNTPNVVICRNPRFQAFWKPDFDGKTHPIFPPAYLPNLKGLRIRDKYWKLFVSPKKVCRKALEILN